MCHIYLKFLTILSVEQNCGCLLSSLTFNNLFFFIKFFLSQRGIKVTGSEETHRELKVLHFVLCNDASSGRCWM